MTDFGFSHSEEALRSEVRQFVENEKELLEKVRLETKSGLGHGPYINELLLKVGARGWLTPHWTEEYGGLGRSHIDRFIIAEELAYAGAPPSPVGATMAGPIILLFGSEEQKQEFLPRISRGECEFALGYTEPQAGSDLAALELRAVDKGDYFVLNGQKVFNTACHYAEYHWLAARTDTTAPRHRGISLFVVDLNSPGITIRPLWAMGGMRTNEVFYDDVRVPKNRLVGEKNKGWYYLGIALGLERTWIVGETRRYFDEVVESVKKSPQLLTPQIRHELAQIAIELKISYLFGAHIAWMLSKGETPTYEAAMAKVFGSELDHRLNNLAMNIYGTTSLLQKNSKYAAQDGIVGHLYFISLRKVITRGSSEIMRNIIALRALGLPHGE